MMKLSDFAYDLPRDLIADEPAPERDGARLLVHDVPADRTEHVLFRDLTRFLVAGDLLVLNDTRVVPTRLLGRRDSGGRVEFLLLESSAPGLWSAFVNPARKPKVGERIPLEGGALVAEMIERPAGSDGRPGMEWTLRLLGPDGRGGDDLALLEAHGRVPLPPYVDRDDEQSAPGSAHARQDRERYQTVFATRAGAVAAPTAGLHFTPELLTSLSAAGVEQATVTLHVGPGTFRPVKVDDPREHRMHAEAFHLPPATAQAVEQTKARGGRVVAVGTTSVRVLESCARGSGPLGPGDLVPTEGRTDLFLYPGRELRVVDALVTNFHLPASTLLMLVSAFAGRERILGLYREAVRRRYRFYSFGDAMFLNYPRRVARP